MSMFRSLLYHRYLIFRVQLPHPSTNCNIILYKVVDNLLHKTPSSSLHILDQNVIYFFLQCHVISASTSCTVHNLGKSKFMLYPYNYFKISKYQDLRSIQLYRFNCLVEEIYLYIKVAIRHGSIFHKNSNHED